VFRQLIYYHLKASKSESVELADDCGLIRFIKINPRGMANAKWAIKGMTMNFG
jgi:hypothetical protein